MKSLLRHLKLVPVMALVWVILEEQLSVASLLTGSLIGLATLLAVDRYVLRGDYWNRYSLGLLPSFRYAAFLIVQIYIAGFQALYKLATGRVNVDIVEITTSLDDDFRISLLANSITLTPGTVTLERSENRLRVIWLDCETKDPEAAAPIIKKSFERLLARGRR